MKMRGAWAEALWQGCRSIRPGRKGPCGTRAAPLLTGIYLVGISILGSRQFTVYSGLPLFGRLAEEFAVADLMPGLGWGHTKVYELLNRAKERGCVGEGASRGRYKFLRDHPSPLRL